MKITEAAPVAVGCPKCNAQVPARVLVCPACGALLHAEELKQLSAHATAAEQTGDTAGALASWRNALNLLPPASNQHRAILSRVEELSRRVDSGQTAGPAQVGNTLPAAAATSLLATGSTLASPPPPAAPATADAAPAPATPQKKTGIAAIGALLLSLVLKFKTVALVVLTKGKLILLGLTKASTFFSMFLSFGVYWSVWGWKFAAGLVISIYIHEMGHVIALRRFGIRATAPMFIPGLGAFIRLKDYPHDARADARTGLAGPLYGLGAAVAAYAIYLATGWTSFAAIAKFGAWINIFNLIPIYPLDGGHGFRALVRWQRFAVAGICAAVWYVTAHLTDGRHGDGMLVFVGIVAAFRAFQKAEATEPDRRTLVEFAVLLVALGAIAAIEVPGFR